MIKVFVDTFVEKIKRNELKINIFKCDITSKFTLNLICEMIFLSFDKGFLLAYPMCLNDYQFKSKIKNLK